VPRPPSDPAASKRRRTVRSFKPTPDAVFTSPSEDARERLVLFHRAAPSGAADGEAASWARGVATRLEVAGGEILARAGSSVAASFDPLEIADVIELALDLIADAAREAQGLEIACGLALGDVQEARDGGGARNGQVIDRAMLLASFAQRGELVLDEAAHASAQEGYLFTRGLRATTVVGHVVDAVIPRKRECRRALVALREAPLPASFTGYARLREIAIHPGVHRVCLRSAQPYAALDWLARLAAELEPDVVLHLGRRAAGLEPLGSLQLALLRAGSAVVPALEPAQADALALLHDGSAVSRSAALSALRCVLAGRRALVVLDRAREIDSPSLLVTLEALASDAIDALLVAVADEQGVPATVARAGALEEIAVDGLSHDERARVAGAVLGLPEGDALSHRVARLGGDTVPGIVEAARTLVCAGDLVLDGDAFRWRTRPRLGSVTIPVDALLTERAAGLDPGARRVLDAACIAPQALSRAAIAKVAALDGLPEDAAAHGLAQLEAEGWLPAGPLSTMEHAIRGAVRNAMPPSRAAELHRFIADVLQESMPDGPSFGRALLAHHLAEGGRDREAAGALLDVAQAATESGFERMAVRLAALALKLDASSDNQGRARRLARRVDTGPHGNTTPLPLTSTTQPPRASEPAKAEEPIEPRQLAANAVRAAIRAIVRGDIDAAESLVDTAVAAGWSRSATQRLWAVAQLKKGDVPAAVRALKQAHAPDAPPQTRAREAITAALILLESGEMIEAVRAALDGLSYARRAEDARGERAALHALAACYRALGREDDAARIEAVAA
jgi:hypothetical protein